MESLVHQLDTVKHFPRGFRNTTPSFSTSELPLHLFYMSMLAHIRPFRYGTGSPPRFISVCFQQFLLSACPFFFYHLRALSLSFSRLRNCTFVQNRTARTRMPHNSRSFLPANPFPGFMENANFHESSHPRTRWSAL